MQQAGQHARAGGGRRVGHTVGRNDQVLGLQRAPVGIVEMQQRAINTIQKKELNDCYTRRASVGPCMSE